MSDRLTASQIEDQVKQLEPGQFKLFSDWFEEYRADLWDRQIEEDARAGRLDHLRNRAAKALQSELCTPL
jgi:hypothetical protein